MQAPRAVMFRAAEHVQDFLPMSKRDILLFDGCEVGWKRAYRNAGVSLDDLSFVETHDCFTIAELIEYEAMGLAKRGQGGAVAMSGETARDGRLPVNPSGGLKSKGHPIGATGGMLIGTLLDELERQDKSTGLVTMCTGGGMGTATIIERV